MLANPTGFAWGDDSVSQLRYNHSGWDWPSILALASTLLFFGPMFLLGGVGMLAWRALGLRQRWALFMLVASFVLPVLTYAVWSVNPFLEFAQAQLSVLGAAILWLVGEPGRMSGALTLATYLEEIAPATLSGSVLIGCALAWVVRPNASVLRSHEATGIVVPRRVEQRVAQGVRHPPGGWALGYRADGQLISVSDVESRQHVIVCGATGTGKTTIVRHILDGVGHRGPVVILDCKASPTLRRAVQDISGSIIWTIGGSTRWDALRGDPTCFASKLLAAEQFGPNAAIYRAAAERYAQWVGRVLEWTATPREPGRVADLLAPKTLAMRLRELRTNAPQEWWDMHGEPLARRLADVSKAEQEGIAGFAARFGVVAEGVAEGSLGVGPGALVLDDTIAEGRTVLFSLNAAAYPTLAAKLGAWILLDLVRVAGLLQEKCWADEGHQCYVVVDEFSALREEGRHVVPLLARAREAGVACVVVTQGLADLERVDRALPQQIVQNTAVRILLRQQSHPDALAWARHLGELEREEVSRRIELAGFGGGARDVGAWSTHWRRDYYVRPEELQALATGDAILQVAPVVNRRCRLERIRIAQPKIGRDRPGQNSQAFAGSQSRSGEGRPQVPGSDP